MSDPVTEPAAAEETARDAERGPAAGHAEETIAEETGSSDRSGEKQVLRTEALLRLVPLQRVPLPES